METILKIAPKKIICAQKYTQITPWAPDVKKFYDKIVEKLDKTNKSIEDVINSRITQYNSRWDMSSRSSETCAST